MEKEEEITQKLLELYEGEDGNLYYMDEEGQFQLYEIRTDTADASKSQQETYEQPTQFADSADVASSVSYLEQIFPVENSGGRIQEVEEEQPGEYSTTQGVKGIEGADMNGPVVRCQRWLEVTIMQSDHKDNMRAWFEEMPKECIVALENIYDTLHAVYCSYIKSKSSGQLTKRNAGVHPNLGMVMRPFGLIHPSKARVVMIGLRPYLNGTANGIPVESQSKGILVGTPSFKAFRYAALKALEAPGNLRDEDVLGYYYRNGILLLNSEMTAEVGFDKRYDIVRSHRKMWADFYYPFLKHCRDMGRAIVLMSKDAHSLKKAIPDYENLKCIRYPSTEDWEAVEIFIDEIIEIYINVMSLELTEQGIDPKEFLEGYWQNLDDRYKD